MILEVMYKNSKLQKVCTDSTEAEKRYGKAMAEKIHLRIKQIEAFPTVEMMIQYRIGRCHGLKGNRKKQYAVDLVHPNRLVFEKIGEQIQIAKVTEIVDYH